MDRTFIFLMSSCFECKDSLIYTFFVDGVWIYDNETYGSLYVHCLIFERVLLLNMQAITDKQDAIRFLPIWNAVIKSLREEDLISNR